MSSYMLTAGNGSFALTGEAITLSKSLNLSISALAQGAQRISIDPGGVTFVGTNTAGKSVYSGLYSSTGPQTGTGTVAYVQLDTEDGQIVNTVVGAVSVMLDRIPGDQATYHIIQNWSLSRLATVTGIPNTDGSGNALTATALLSIAISAVVSITGNVGAPCPDIAQPTYLEQFVPEMISSDSVSLRVLYKGYPAPQFEFAGSLSQVETNKDNQGNLITVQYKYPSTYTQDPRLAGQTITQGGMISRPTPEPIFIMRFIVATGTINGVAVSAMDLVSSFKALYEGTSNSNTYAIGAIVGAPGQWLIDQISATSRDGGFSFEMAWTYHYRISGWDPLVVFIAPADGKPPPDLQAGVGYKTVGGPYRSAYPTFVFPSAAFIQGNIGA